MTEYTKNPLATIDIINQTITQVCIQKHIKCLHAIESGSRAWGFASPDSDFDVRLIYCHEPSWYLQLFDDKGSFEYIQNDLFEVPFDIGGWDIKKALTLIYKSNAVIFEWLHSPIVYQQHADYLNELRAISVSCFNPIAVFHHYRGMAKTASQSLKLTEAIKLKKWFYLLRALLACRWVQLYKTPPPIVMADMLILLDKLDQKDILELINLKQQVGESHRQPLSINLQRVIADLWQHTESATFNSPNAADIRTLNDYFQRVIFQK